MICKQHELHSKTLTIQDGRVKLIECIPSSEKENIPLFLSEQAERLARPILPLTTIHHEGAKNIHLVLSQKGVRHQQREEKSSAPSTSLKTLGVEMIT